MKLRDRFFSYFSGKISLSQRAASSRRGATMCIAAALLLFAPVENSPFQPISEAFAAPFDGRTFSAEIPEAFVEVKIEQPFVELALRDARTGLPSLNVIALPPESRPASTAEEYAAKTLESYRKVGFSDATLVESGTRDLAGAPAFFARLRFKGEGEARESCVITCPLASRDLVITFLDTQAHVETALPRFEAFLASLVLHEVPRALEIPDATAAQRRRILLLAGAGIAAFFGSAAFIVILRRRPVV